MIDSLTLRGLTSLRTVASKTSRRFLKNTKVNEKNSVRQNHGRRQDGENRSRKHQTNFHTAHRLVGRVGKAPASSAAGLCSIPDCAADFFPGRVIPSDLKTGTPGAGIMEADDRQVTTVFTVQPSFHHRHSTNRVS